MLALLTLINITFAQGLHTGIPVHGIGGLSAPIFQTSATGWSAQIPRGIVQVYVAPTEDEAIGWMAQVTEKMVKYRPGPNPEYIARFQVDEAVGDGIGLLIVRDNNLAYMVRHDGQATDWAATLHESIVDIPVPWPQPAILERSDGIWAISNEENIVHIAFVGGETVDTPELRFKSLPDRIVVWDGWGRATVTERNPIDD